MEYVEGTVKVHEEAEKKLLDAIADSLGSQRFDLWFGPETTIRVEDDKIVFGVRKRFAADWIRNHLLKDLDRACFQAFGKSLPIEIVVQKANASLSPVKKPHCFPVPDGRSISINQAARSVSPSVPPSQSPLYSIVAAANPEQPSPEQLELKKLLAPKILPPQKTGRRFASLKTFVEGLSNRLACRAADLAVNHPGQINPIYIYGPTSVGKTHLLEGIWSEVRRQKDRKPPLYLTTEQFVSSFLEGIQSGSSRNVFQTFRNKFKDISILLIDDIQYLYRKDATQTEFLYTIDMLRSRNVQIVLTGDRPLRELTGLKQEIVCRLEAGMVCGIEQPERETALKIFQNMVAQRQLSIGADVCRMVTARLGAHARQLSGALNRLHAVHLATGNEITLELAEETLADLIRGNRRNVRLKDIEQAVCDTFGISEESLQSKSRNKQIATPRMLAMWLARKYTRSGLSEIGKYFGNRSHSTVITAQKKVDAWVDLNNPIHADDFDMPIAEAIQKIERILQSG